uniref:Uncharacterized protein n=1 Tax=Sphaerodactylus townsendi TaxID=933632 RepID=A0ACB8FTP6_9SAUR
MPKAFRRRPRRSVSPSAYGRNTLVVIGYMAESGVAEIPALRRPALRKCNSEVRQSTQLPSRVEKFNGEREALLLLPTNVDFASFELKEGILIVVARQQHEGGKRERMWLDVHRPEAILGLPVISWEL